MDFLIHVRVGAIRRPYGSQVAAIPTIVDVDWGNCSPERAVYPWYILYVEKRTTMSSNLLLIAIDHRLMRYY